MLPDLAFALASLAAVGWIALWVIDLSRAAHVRFLPRWAWALLCMFCIPAGSNVSSVARYATPALFTRIVTGPNSAPVSCIILSTCAGSPTSARTAIARPPDPRISSTRDSAAAAVACSARVNGLDRDRS